LLGSRWNPLAQALRLTGLRAPDDVDCDLIEAGKVTGKHALMMWSTQNGPVVLVDDAAGFAPRANIVTVEPKSTPAAIIALVRPLPDAGQGDSRSWARPHVARRARRWRG